MLLIRHVALHMFANAQIHCVESSRNPVIIYLINSACFSIAMHTHTHIQLCLKPMNF